MVAADRTQPPPTSIPNNVAPFLVLIEKVVMTYIEGLISLLVISGSNGAVNVSTAQAAAVAAIPAALTVIANGLPVVPIGLPFWIDAVLRTARTYVVSFIGLLVAMPVFNLDYSAFVCALSGALPATLAAGKALIATRFGESTSAALLPVKYDVPAAAAA